MYSALAQILKVVLYASVQKASNCHQLGEDVMVSPVLIFLIIVIPGSVFTTERQYLN